MQSPMRAQAGERIMRAARKKQKSSIGLWCCILINLEAVCVLVVTVSVCKRECGYCHSRGATRNINLSQQYCTFNTGSSFWVAATAIVRLRRTMW